MLNPTTDPDKIRDYFGRLAGADFIASRWAIVGLQKWLRRVKPERVLEVGTGLGTLTYTIWATQTERVLDHSLVSLEGNPQMFGRAAPHIPAGEYEQTWIKQTDPDAPNVAMGKQGCIRYLGVMPDDWEPYDFIVIDGDVAVEDIAKRLRPHHTVFIEGWRFKLQSGIATWAPDTYARCMREQWRGRGLLARGQCAAYTVFRFDPTRWELDWMSWLDQSWKWHHRPTGRFSDGRNRLVSCAGCGGGEQVIRRVSDYQHWSGCVLKKLATAYTYPLDAQWVPVVFGQCDTCGWRSAVPLGGSSKVTAETVGAGQHPSTCSNTSLKFVANMTLADSIRSFVVDTGTGKVQQGVA